MGGREESMGARGIGFEIEGFRISVVLILDSFGMCLRIFLGREVFIFVKWVECMCVV